MQDPTPKSIMRLALLLFFVLPIVYGQSREFWMKQGQKSLHEAIRLRQNKGVAKNVILFLGDGMGVSTYTAARILKGQLEGKTGEEYRLQMEKFPYAGLVKTYAVNQQTTDSAAAATSFLTGVKSNAGMMGVDSRVTRGDCSKLPNAALDTIIDWALEEGKSVGVVSTSRITHATPGAAYAKIPDRHWENDAKMKNAIKCSHVKDIARQLVEDNHRIHVLLGGGRRNFLPKSAGGEREDKRDLIQAWKMKQKAKGVTYQYVDDRDQLNKVPSETDYLFGLFQKSHMNYDADRNKDKEPSISEMFEAAHKILSKNSKGYFLLIEGGLIDHAHHRNMAHQALLDTIAFDAAISRAVRLTNEKDTLILATADHSHVFTMAGYPIRGHDIVGKMMFDGKGSRVEKAPYDKKPMTILMYANGPGPQRTDLTNVETTGKNFVFPNGVHARRTTHGGEDVAVFALGPMSHLIGGLQEQNVLAHVMAYATCIGPDKSHCTGNSSALSNLINAKWKTFLSVLLAISLGSRW